MAVRIIEHQTECESGLVMLADAHRMGELRKPATETFQHCLLQRTQIRSHLASLRVIPISQFLNQLKQPCQPIGTFKAGASFSPEICCFVGYVLSSEALPQGFARGRREIGIGKGPDQPHEQPMSVHRGMPVVTTVESGSQFSWRGYIRIAVQGMTDVIW